MVFFGSKLFDCLKAKKFCYLILVCVFLEILNCLKFSNLIVIITIVMMVSGKNRIKIACTQ